MRCPVRMRSLCIGLLGLAIAVVACRRGDRWPGDLAGADVDASHAAIRYPVHLQDDRGANVTISSEPMRIVALLPSHTETLVALGLGSRVVGVDDYSDLPPEMSRLPRLGGLFDTQLEVVLSLKPDLVLMSETNPAAAALERSGISVWAGSARTFDDVFRVIEAIGTIVGKSFEARQLSAQIVAEVVSIEERIRGVDRVRVYYEIDANLYTVGPTSFIGVMLDKAGGVNIVPAGLGDFPKISPEAVISGNPTIILGVSLEEAAKRPGWSQIAAVQTGRVYKLPKVESQLIVHPGPRIADGLRVLVRRLHPAVHL